MLEELVRLPEDKQKRIIDAAIGEFAQHSYRQASTDRIAVAAGISKGSLFAYFGDKRQMYLSLFRYMTERMMAAFAAEQPDEPDLLLRWGRAFQTKLALMREHPHIFDLLIRMATERDKAVHDDVHGELERLMGRALPNMSAGIDTSCYREGLDPQLTTQAILWTLEGYARAEQAHYEAQGRRLAQIDWEELGQSFGRILTLLRTVYYRP